MSSDVQKDLHGTAVAINGCGVLLLGRSGAGKSDLALRLIDRGALLIADDRVIVHARDGQLWLSAPARLAGLIELRGQGVHLVPAGRHSLQPVPALIGFDLARAPERLPAFQWLDVGELRLPLLPLAGLEASAPLRVEWGVSLMRCDGIDGFDVNRPFR